MAAPTVRPVHDEELAAFIGVQRTAMLHGPPGDDDVAVRRALWPAGRALAAFDAEGTLCGTARSFPTDLRVPGGSVRAGAVSSVGVLPTHRRQGHLSRLMSAQLADVAAREEPVAILVSAEWPIYGRYGYGVATEACGVRLDAVTAAFRDPPTGSTVLVEAKAFREALTDVYERTWQRTPGHMTWDEPWDDVWAGLREIHDGGDEARRLAVKVVWRDGAGEVQGAAAYSVRDAWVDNRPRGGLTTSIFLAATDEAERELYRYLTTVDWVATVQVGLRPVDDPLPFRLVDGRAAVLADRFDHIWLRVLDVPAALGARGYGAMGSFVIEVVDPDGFGGGRFALDAGPDGAECVPAPRRSPDLVAPITALGAAYLGGLSWARLAAAGWVDERRPGAVAEASAMFTAPRAPWCSTPF
ncbi:MAG TPA: GNAT family N-acetyltransferase [Acidimicrobiales bacterium]|nr:GNAT family N-acetyltransferase [Acidimicrobiales bacterium]